MKTSIIPWVLGAIAVYVLYLYISFRWKRWRSLSNNAKLVRSLMAGQNTLELVRLAVRYGWYHPKSGLLPPFEHDHFALDVYTLGMVYGYLHNCGINLGLSQDICEPLTMEKVSFGQIEKVVQRIETWDARNRETFLKGTDVYEKESGDGDNMFRFVISSKAMVRNVFRPKFCGIYE